MQFSNFLGLAAIFSLAQAAPLVARDTGVIVFHGAAGAEYSVTVPLDGSTTYTYNKLSISTISSNTINVQTQCSIHAIDKTPALVALDAHTWAMGPPQTVIDITCTGGSVKPQPQPSTIVIEFQGADPDKGAKYSLTVPLDGSVVTTFNALSISTLVSSYAALPQKCHFDYVDRQAVLVLLSGGALNKWAVGPPQTIRSVSCT